MESKVKEKRENIGLSLNYVQILEVNACVAMENEDDVKSGRMNGVKSIQIDENELSITVYDNLTAVSDADEIINIKIKAIANFDYKCDKPLDVKKLEKDEDFLGFATDAAFSVTSLVIGILTDKMSCVQPMIVPPFLVSNLMK